MSILEALQSLVASERQARADAELLLKQKTLEVDELRERLQTTAAQLREQEDRSNGIIETAVEGVITYDASGKITTFNRSAECMFEFTDHVPCNIRTLFASNLGTETILFPQMRDEAEQTTCDIYNELTEIRGLRGSGESFVVEASVARREFEGRVYFIALVRDASKRKKLEALLTQAQKMETVGQLAAGIAHEINTPIQFVSDNIQFLEGAFEDLGTLIDLYGSLLKETRDSDGIQDLVSCIDEKSEMIDLPFLREEFPQAIAQSLDGIQRVSTVVRALKDFSQPVNELVSAINLQEMISNVLIISRNQWVDIAEVRTDFAKDLPGFMGRPGHLNQALVNLFSNAIEAITAKRVNGGLTEKGLIEIEAIANAQELELRITDNGVGIPVDIQHRIFDPFFTTKDVGQGTGQGLSMVYDVIVGRHDGLIDFTSEPGCGTTFTIKLPMNLAQSPQPAGQYAHASY